MQLLRSLRPAPAFSPDEAALERILAAPPEPQRGRRQRRRRPALALAGAVALAAVAVALAPSLRASPDVVARAAAALNGPDTILHLKPVDAGGKTMEVWQADGGRKERWLYRGGTDRAVESMDDWDTRTALSYSAQNDELITHTEPDWFDTKHYPIHGSPTAPSRFTAPSTSTATTTAREDRRAHPGPEHAGGVHRAGHGLRRRPAPRAYARERAAAADEPAPGGQACHRGAAVAPTKSLRLDGPRSSSSAQETTIVAFMNGWIWQWSA